MCIFTGIVKNVGNTRVFARLSGQGTQFLVYSMSYGADTELAMILPLPVTSFHKTKAVRFIALDDYPTFFDDLFRGFPRHPAHDPLGLSCGADDGPRRLPVHQVGAYEASFVPTLADFARLDARFTLPTVIWDQLPQYRHRLPPTCSWRL